MMATIIRDASHSRDVSNPSRQQPATACNSKGDSNSSQYMDADVDDQILVIEVDADDDD